MTTKLSEWNENLRKKKLTQALAARKLKDEGWTNGRLIDKFEICEVTLQRWFKMVEELDAVAPGILERIV